MGRLWKLAGRRALVCVAACLAAGVPARAQSSADAVALGDSAYARRNAAGALAQYLRAVAADSLDYLALHRASRTAVDLAEREAKGRGADTLLAMAQRYAEAAIRVRPNDAEGHFALARAFGRRALSVGTMDRIKFSKVVRTEALAALSHDSTHAGALHVLGMWHAEVMRVNGLARAFARTFLGADVFSLANWNDAQRLLAAAVRVDPGRIVHQLDLAGILADRGKVQEARDLYAAIGRAPLIEPNDDLYKRQAADRLGKL